MDLRELQANRSKWDIILEIHWRLVVLRSLLLLNWLASRLLVSVILRSLLLLWMPLLLLLALWCLLAALLLWWQLNVIHQDARARVFNAVLLPLIELECACNCNRRALGDVLSQLLGSLAKYLACDPAGFFVVAISGLNWQVELADCLSAACVLYFHRLAASA